ncbi:hypothetical protein BHM03_00043657 [Ensete ventricosum]|nr:hypothetical protein BHM03_00043657 [Ensete ventricosum]
MHADTRTVTCPVFGRHDLRRHHVIVPRTTYLEGTEPCKDWLGRKPFPGRDLGVRPRNRAVAGHVTVRVDGFSSDKATKKRGWG